MQTLKVRKKVLKDHGLERHLLLLNKMKPCHMSGDEPEVDSADESMMTHPQVYIILELAWQSKELIAFLRLLDAWHIADRFQAVGDSLRGGNAPRKRIPGDEPKYMKGAAPKALWRNCYDPDWLASLKPCVRESLDIIPRDYPFGDMPGWEKVAPKGEETPKMGQKTPGPGDETPPLDVKGKGKARESPTMFTLMAA